MNAVLKPSIQLSGIPVEQIPQVWTLVRPFIERVLKRGNGEHTPETLLESLNDRSMQLWIGHDGDEIIHVGLTQIIKYQTGKTVAEITHLSGSRMNEWAEDHCRIIEDWARANGCTDVNIIGRKGWERVHKEYKPLYLTITRKL